MKILLSSIGSVGDVQPFLALATFLRDAGFSIEMCGLSLYESRFQEFGITYHSVGNPIEHQDLHDAFDKAFLAGPGRSAHVTMMETFQRINARRFYDDCRRVSEGFDLAIFPFTNIITHAAFLDSGVPQLTVSLWPGNFSHGGRLQSFAGAMAKRVLGMFTRRFVRRMAVDLDLVSESDRLMNHLQRERPWMLVAISRHFESVPSCPDERIRLAGHWRLSEPLQPLPAACQEILSGDSKPVVISFGSMGGTHAQATTQILCDAAQMVDQPVVIQRGWADLGGDETANASDVTFVGYVPHDQLFANASCVVHHGGAGTIHAACRSGVPSVIVPHLGDQYRWGQHLHQLGLASRPLPRRELTADRLAQRIRDVVQSDQTAQAAIEIGADMRREYESNDVAKLVEETAAAMGIR